MKQTFVVLSLSVLVVGCGKSSSTTSEPAPKPSELVAKPTEPAVAPVAPPTAPKRATIELVKKGGPIITDCVAWNPTTHVAACPGKLYPSPFFVFNGAKRPAMTLATDADYTAFNKQLTDEGFDHITQESVALSPELQTFGSVSLQVNHTDTKFELVATCGGSHVTLRSEAASDNDSLGGTATVIGDYAIITSVFSAYDPQTDPEHLTPLRERTQHFVLATKTCESTASELVASGS